MDWIRFFVDGQCLSSCLRRASNAIPYTIVYSPLFPRMLSAARATATPRTTKPRSPTQPHHDGTALAVQEACHDRHARSVPQTMRPTQPRSAPISGTVVAGAASATGNPKERHRGDGPIRKSRATSHASDANRPCKKNTGYGASGMVSLGQIGDLLSPAIPSKET